MDYFLFVILVLTTTMTHSSLVTFEASPHELKGNLTKNLGMRCAVTDNNVDDIPRITGILITKNQGEDVASITTFDAAALALTDQGNLEAKGSLSSTSGAGNLQLTWVTPGAVSLGVYLCQVTGIDSAGHTVVMTSSLTLSSSQPSVDDVIHAFHDKFLAQEQLIQAITQENNQLKAETSTLKAETTAIKAETAKIKADMSNLNTCACPSDFDAKFLSQEQLIQRISQENNDLKAEASTLKAETSAIKADTSTLKTETSAIKADTSMLKTETSVIKADTSTLKAEVAKIKADMSNLKTCPSSKVAFNAGLFARSFGHDKKLPLTSGSLVKWDNVTLNLGGGYRPSSGKFHCTVPGIYVFHVHAHGAPDSVVCLQLEKNGVEMVDLYRDDETDKNGASLSHVLSLDAGDVVGVKVTYYCSTVLYQDFPHTTLAHVNYFMGYLISAAHC